MSPDLRPTLQPYSIQGSASELLGLLIPSFADKRVAILDLDHEARAWVTRPNSSITDPKAFADASVCAQFVNELHALLGIDASLGGYLEDREFLWQGTYLGGTDRTLHLGVDLNVPAGTPVVTPFDGKVIRCDNDSPERFGWGPRVFIERTEPAREGSSERWVYIFAHLADIRVSEGDIVNSGDEIAVVGAPPTNGNWHPHLHLQKARGSVFDQFLSQGIWTLDGYGPRSKRDSLANDFPDPFSFLPHKGGG